MLSVVPRKGLGCLGDRERAQISSEMDSLPLQRSFFLRILKVSPKSYLEGWVLPLPSKSNRCGINMGNNVQCFPRKGGGLTQTSKWGSISRS